jgi:hypothetical protein
MNASAHSVSHGHDDHHADGHDGHGGGHGHITLQYQPGLPLSRGKLIMWLFLSTEIMFFAALLGSYVVLRFGAPVWPKPHHVHLSEPIGAFNTFVLICSSVTIVLALEAARANRTGLAKFWMVLTLALGTLFLGVKGYEYQAKFSHGIYPWSPRSRVFEKPDLYYGSAVRARLGEPAIMDRLKELDAAAEAQNRAAMAGRPARKSRHSTSPKFPSSPHSSGTSPPAGSACGAAACRVARRGRLRLASAPSMLPPASRLPRHGPAT